MLGLSPGFFKRLMGVVPGFNISDIIHKRWCRFIIHRYLGQFLERNLSYDQLSLDLSKGCCVIEEINLNAQFINDFLQAANIPLRLVEGFIGRISCEVPWGALLSRSSLLKVEGLQLTFHTEENIRLDDKNLVSTMIGSVMDSLVSSEELARSFCEEETEGETPDKDGVESFTKIIDAIVSRFCVEMLDTTIRLENPATTDRDYCTALEIRIEKVEFVDEQMKNCKQEGKAVETITSEPQGLGSITNLNKFLYLTGVSFYTDVFSRIDEPSQETSQIITSMYLRREIQKQKSPSRTVEAQTLAQNQAAQATSLYTSTMSVMSNYQSCHSQLPGLDSTPSGFKVTKAEPDLISDPVKFAEFTGETTIVLRIHNSDLDAKDATDNKFEVDIFFKSLNVCIQPSQVKILSNFFNSMVIPPKNENYKENGRRMEEADLVDITRTLEEISFQNNQPQALGMGNWKQVDEFKEFDSINLNETRSNRGKSSESNREAGFSTLKSDQSQKRNIKHIKAKFGSIVVIIPHEDILSAENVNKHKSPHAAVDLLNQESKKFFERIAKSSLNFAMTSPHLERQKLDELYEKNHIRFVGSSILFDYAVDSYPMSEQMTMKLSVANCDCVEYLTAESNPGTGTPYYAPILDFSGFENPEREPHVKLVLQSNSLNNLMSKLQVYIGHCHTEIDLSIVDRIADLLSPRSFFDRPSFDRGRLDSINRKPPAELSDDLFGGTEKPAASTTQVDIVCENWTIDLRVPMADLRNPAVDRLPYNQRNVHPEYLQFKLLEALIDIPLTSEATSVTITCSEMLGDFCGVSDLLHCEDHERRFFYGGRQSIDNKVCFKLVYDPRNQSLKTSGAKLMKGLDEDIMNKSLSEPVITAVLQQEGPFAQTKNYSTLNQTVRAGSRKEMLEFGDQCMLNSKTLIIIDVPILRLNICNHDYLEVLYNRLVNDLALWQPAAPALTAELPDFTIKPLSEEFFHFGGGAEKTEYYEDDVCEASAYPLTREEYNRSQAHNFSLQLNVNKGVMVMGTTVKENSKPRGLGQIALEMSQAQLFTVVGYHGLADQTFFYTTTETLSLGQSGVHARIPRNIQMKDFGKWGKDDAQIEFLKKTDEFNDGSGEDSFGIALHLRADRESNSKNILVSIALRNSIAHLRPYRDSGHLWLTQLADFFSLKDYNIPGYEMPRVTTDLHVDFNNVVLAYDHCWVNPESPLRLRLVLGHSSISTAIIQDVDVAKFLIVLEKSKLLMSNEKKRSESRVGFRDQVARSNSVNAAEKQFITVISVALFHLEILQSAFVDPVKRHSPQVELRCKNDNTEVYVCADSLVALINMYSEISESDAYKPIPVQEDDDVVDDSFDDYKEARSVLGESIAETEESEAATAAGSTWSRPASLASHKLNQANRLPIHAEQKLQEALHIATQDTKPRSNSATMGIAVGTEAIEEFSADFSMNKEREQVYRGALREANALENRTISVSTDEEFIMVDDIIGSGVTSATGEPKIKYIGRNAQTEPEGARITIDPHYLQMSDEWRGDGQAAMPDNNFIPHTRYFVKDFSIGIHLFGGSDLAQEAPLPPNYSTDEFRSGVGKGQNVLPIERGGKHRDHSVAIELKFNKITYLHQVYDAEAPVRATTFFSIYDFVVMDKLTASGIKQMVYQYSNSIQPRRTCAPMFAARMRENHDIEGKMRVSMLPIKLNIDQDTMNFIEDFVDAVTTNVHLPNEVVESVSDRPLIEVPATIEPSAATRKETSRLYPSLSNPSSINMNMMPLTPSPVAPTSPLGDLSYLESRGSCDSPLKHPLADAPLTESVTSIGNMFDSNIRANSAAGNSLRQDSPESNSPEIFMFGGLTKDENQEDGLEMAGDWKDDNPELPELPALRTHLSVDEMLQRSTMEHSFHPDLAEDNLVDTGLNGNSDEESDNDRRTVCDGENTPMATSEIIRKSSVISSDPNVVRGITYYKEFVFSPSVSIYIDYQGKNKYSMDKGGAMISVLKGIGKLNKTEIVLKEILNQGGLLGTGRCLNHALNEWSNDIMTNIPSVIASCGPISPLVQIGRGVVDLFWQPVSEYRKPDGHIVKGIQKGVGSFGLSSAAGIVGMMQTVVGMVQTVADSVLYEVQPDAAYLNQRNRRPINNRPPAAADLSQGMQLAYQVASDGVRQARDDFELAAQEDRASGHSSFRSMVRYATPAVIRPIAMGTRMSFHILEGLRNQLQPDQCEDERHKWRDDEIPGSSAR